jgi:endo-alpha-1,4-polygalactosaminidase (GH114 family)
MASYAASLGMATGLKNAQEILSEVTEIVQFAVNEQCSASSGCTEYDSFLATGKPVFHIEYVDDNGKSGQGKSSKVKRADLTTACADSQLSTVVKYMALDGWVEYCDGSSASTAINKNYKTGDPKQGGNAAGVIS